MSEFSPAPEANAAQSDLTQQWANMAQSVAAEQQQPQAETQPEPAATGPTVERVGEAEAPIEGDIYDYEYRKKVNEPVHDLLAKRRAIILKQFPALVRSNEDTIKAVHDPDYAAKIRAELDKIPKDIQDEFYISGRIMGRLQAGIFANLTPDHKYATSEPDYVPREVKTEKGSVISTVWRADITERDLARLQELHEKNSQIIDFSHEDEVDIDTIPEDVQQTVSELRAELEALKTTDIADFKWRGKERPKTATVFDKIYKVSPNDQMSLETQMQINATRHELMRQYILAENAAEIRDIDRRIVDLQAEKESIAERQEQAKSAKTIARLFQRLTRPNLEQELSRKSEEIDSRIAKMQKEIEEIQQRKA